MRQQSKKNQKIQDQIRARLKKGEWATGAPLPPARELAEDHGVSSSTAYRILVQLMKEGVLWQHSNGRFYAADARYIVDSVQPFACMLPRLQLWNVVLQQIMHGVTQRSAHFKRGILLIHNPALVVQNDINIPPAYASAEMQEKILNEFFATHADSCEGIIFDNVWKDEVLAKFKNRLKRMVVINRKTSLDFVSAVFPNFHRCALLAFAHLYARGYDRIHFVAPHDDYFIQQAMDMALSTARMIGAGFTAEDFRSPRTPAERQAYLRELRKANQRIGVYCPDDNWSISFYKELKEAGLDCPGRIGLLSGIGTSVVGGDHPLSTVKVDYEKIGELAVDCLRADVPRSERVDVGLSMGVTT